MITSDVELGLNFSIIQERDALGGHASRKRASQPYHISRAEAMAHKIFIELQLVSYHWKVREINLYVVLATNPLPVRGANRSHPPPPPPPVNPAYRQKPDFLLAAEDSLESAHTHFDRPPTNRQYPYRMTLRHTMTRHRSSHDGFLRRLWMYDISFP